MSKFGPEEQEFKERTLKLVMEGKLPLFDNVSIEEYSHTLDGAIERTIRDSQSQSIEEIKEGVKWKKSHNRNELHYAAYFGLVEQVALHLLPLMSLHHYYQKDDFGFMPLDYAQQQGHTKVVQMLKEFENMRCNHELIIYN